MTATVMCLETEEPCAPVRGVDVCRCRNCMKVHPTQCKCGICGTVPRFWANLSLANAL